MAKSERTMSAKEYLAFERQSETRHEFLDGEVVAVSGANRAHGRIVWNLVQSLAPQLESRGCEGFIGEMRVYIPVTDRYTYPDLVVVCGEPRFEDDKLDTLLNPTLIAEIVSPTAEDKGWGTKLFQYRGIPSLQIILLAAHDRVHVELYLRQEDGTWILTDFDDLGDVLELPAIGSRLVLADVYSRVPGL